MNYMINKFNTKDFKKKKSKESMIVAWHPTTWWGIGGCQRMKKKQIESNFTDDKQFEFVFLKGEFFVSMNSSVSVFKW